MQLLIESIIEQYTEQYESLSETIKYYETQIKELETKLHMTYKEYQKTFPNIAKIISFYEYLANEDSQNHDFYKFNKINLKSYIEKIIEEALINNEISEKTALKIKADFKQNGLRPVYSQIFNSYIAPYHFINGNNFLYSKIIDLAFTRYLNDLIKKVDTNELAKLFTIQSNEEYKEIYEKLYTTEYLRNKEYQFIFLPYIESLSILVKREKELSMLRKGLENAKSKMLTAETRRNNPLDFMLKELNINTTSQDIDKENISELLKEQQIINIMRKEGLIVPKIEKYTK